MCQNEQMSMTDFVIKQCRRHSLLYNKRTTILSQPDEIQLIQYCLACYRQKNKEDFDATPAETLDITERIHQIQIGILEKLLQSYHHYGKQEVKKDSNDADLNQGCKYTEPSGIDVTNFDSPPDKDPEEIGEKHDMERDTELKGVYTLFLLHKETSNHHSILDCHIKFMQELSNCESNLHLFIKSCEKMKILAYDEDFFSSLQTKMFDILKDLNANFYLDTERDKSSQMEESLVSEPKSPGIKISEDVKTPLRARLLDNSNTPLHSPRQFSTPKTPRTPAQRKEMQRAFVYNLFCCYIHLLVNSRSQLALARVFNIPERGLDHTAFTHVKHEASSAGLSMYQFLSSFVMRIRLGGQGYAPSTDTPLIAYIKGLGCLLDFTQKLQTVVEEVTDLRSACRRVVNIVKNSLVHCKSGKFTRKLVEPCAVDIQTSLLEIIDAEATAAASPPKAAGAGGTVLGRQCVQVLQSFLDCAALRVSTDADHKMLQDLSFSSHSPTRIPCLLSQFRSPCLLEIEPEKAEKKCKQSLKALKKSSGFVSSALYLEETDEPIMTQGLLTSIEVLPSNTLVEPKACDGRVEKIIDKPALRMVTDQTNKVWNTKKTSRAEGKGKRKAISDQENQDRDVISDGSKVKRSTGQEEKQMKQFDEGRQKSQKVGKSCRKRLLPQVKGQSKITGFFRV